MRGVDVKETFNFLSLVIPSVIQLTLSMNCNLSKQDMWHYRLRHPSLAKLKVLRDELKIPSSLSQLSSHRKICHLAKDIRLSFSSNNNMTLSPFDLIHINIWVPLYTETYNGDLIFLTMFDDCSHATWV